ncbi:MAG: pyridoxal phosphate-dependent aminotransferase [Bacteroidales bacterium]|nr:pyridoxal phosphate-dependent aminotransferase [Bacteroidales bacterium]
MFDFDTLVPRRGTSCVKWDAQPPVPVEGDIIPLWVADMDFPVAPCIQAALRSRMEHGIYGYTVVPQRYYTTVRDWFRDRHGWDFDPAWIQYTTGVVPALSAVIQALTRPGDKVILQTPVYNCFFSSVRNAGCEVLDSPLLRQDLSDGRFTYRFDEQDLARKCADPSARLLLLCNPHNPAGRVWREDELRRVAEICRAHDVIPVCDEIHCEIVAPGLHYTPFATVCAQDWIVLSSASKSFNTAGLQMANIICPREEWRRRIDKAININEICDVNPFGPVAMTAAYSDEGAAWLAEMNAYVAENYRLLHNCFAERLPGFPVAVLEGTYLPWIDVRALGMPSAEVENSLLRHEQVWVNAGAMYGTEGYIRINIATPRALLAEGLDRVVAGLKRLQAL